MVGFGFAKAIAALIFVLTLIWGLSLLLRRMGPGFMAKRSKSAARRVQIVEVLPIDPRRRLMLIRRDDAEHLLLLGHEQDVVVEANIKTSAKKTKKDS